MKFKADQEGDARYYQPQQQPGYGYQPQQQAGGAQPEQQAGYGYQPQQQPGYGYQPQQQAGGAQPEQQAGYGYQPQQQMGYGYQPQQQAGGAQPEQQTGYGYQPQQQTGYGYQPQQQTGYGYQPQQQTGYGYQPQQQTGYGYQPQQQTGYGYQSPADGSQVWDGQGAGADSASPPETPASTPTVRYYLLRDTTGERVEIAASLLVGTERGTVTYCVTGNPAVSRRHALFAVQDGCCYVTDQGSTNGTYVNDFLLTAHTQYVLEGGCRITLANEPFSLIREET